jgi:hypothetical protein
VLQLCQNAEAPQGIQFHSYLAITTKDFSATQDAIATESHRNRISCDWHTFFNTTMIPGTPI